jgi:hypothetical protein
VKQVQTLGWIYPREDQSVKVHVAEHVEDTAHHSSLFSSIRYVALLDDPLLVHVV